jgi:hypothetical protein
MGQATGPVQLTLKFGMTWKPTADMDEKIRDWMKAKGWEVTATDYHFDQEIYAWRHTVRGGKSPTLRITRYVLEHFRHSPYSITLTASKSRVPSGHSPESASW